MNQDQKVKNDIDFYLASIEEFISHPRGKNARENAQYAAANLRRLLDVFHLQGQPEAVTRDEYNAEGERVRQMAVSEGITMEAAEKRAAKQRSENWQESRRQVEADERAEYDRVHPEVK